MPARQNSPFDRNARGFTLIEVMIVVAIIAIISAVAVPQYKDYVTRSHFAEATSHLATLQTQSEQFYMDTHTYVGVPGCNTDSTTSKYFTFTCPSAATATSYAIQAQGQGQMAGFTFQIDNNGVKSTPSVATGWTKPSPNTCWIARKDGSC